MSYSIGRNNMIKLTRGDTFVCDIKMTKQDGYPYDPEEGDVIRFAMKSAVKDEEPLILKEIPIDTMQLMLNPEDTKELPFGVYCYDVELTKANGMVDTFITKSVLVLEEEVY